MLAFIVLLLDGLALRLEAGAAAVGLVDRGRMPGPITKLLNLGRSYSMWVYQWGLACCAIEMGAAFASPRYDVMRLGVIPLPASPRQADFVVDLRHRHRQDGAGHPAPVRPDARAEVRHLDGQLRQLRRPVLGQLLGHQGRRPDHPGRHLRPRLPAAAGGPARGHRPAAAAHPATRTWAPSGAARAPRSCPSASRSSSAVVRLSDDTDRDGRGAGAARRRAARGHRRRAPPRASATALVDSELRPNDDLWVRVATDAWRAAGRGPATGWASTYFCFLSAIDWMPSPYGRGEDDPTEPPPERTTEISRA